MLVVDNFIPIAYQEEIKKILLSNAFPWHFTDDITFGRKELGEEKSPANAHLFRFNRQTTSDFYSVIAPLAYLGADHANYQFTDVVQCRSFLQFPLSEKYIKSNIDKLHIDLPFDHLVVLYYVMDSDGDTIIVDKIHTGGEEEMNSRVEDYNIVQQITPKQGRAVIFDGRHYHTAQQPVNGMRCIINFDII